MISIISGNGSLSSLLKTLDGIEMTQYVINKNPQPTPAGEHEVHKNDGSCNHMPDPANRIALGDFSGCAGAVAEAKRRYPGKQVDGCYYCANACHTR